MNRPTKIDVADSRPEEKGTYRGNRQSRSYKQSYSGNFERGEKGITEESRERPKLDLKPRTENIIKETNVPDISYQTAKFNPFGEAKPRDENLYLKKIEEDKRKKGEEDKGRSPGLPTEAQISKESVDYGASKNREAIDTKGGAQLRDRDSQKRDDKFKNKIDKGTEKPFVRGSKSQDRGNFKKDERKGDRTKKERDERKDDKPPRESEIVKTKQLVF